MAEPRILVRVGVDDLPTPARLLLDADLPRPADSRFLVRRSQLVWVPLAWLMVLLPVGGVALVALFAPGSGPRSGERCVVYGAIGALCLAFATVNIRSLLRGLSEREQVRRGTYRQGLHVIGRDGLLLAGRDVHTWVPRSLMPPAADVTPPGGGPQVPTYAFVFTDGRCSERLECASPTRMALWLWAERGQLPADGGWV